ncbi:hypothetical protein [Methylobacterium soli]|uniref:Uncharacterized protein n=1 Tax=Methylobacterium soli TaxID=553447 RepID=A0A6L3T0V5_9HYPH|nr:hypothetical protein [Methylobacterium soli]KAB1079589.1 hypothetical protein F6X53_09870 [Methylobacterium soli]GJE44542.1 hypothetical protein AEGHOMDF_3731 [Methylobacterium soli]
MLRLASPLALTLLLLAPAAARADACDGLAQQIAEATGGKVGRRSGPSIDIKVPGSIKIDLTCRAEPIVQASSGDPTPSALFFRDLSIASQLLVGEPAGTVQSVLGKAYQTALSERRKSFIQQNGWSASCYTDSAGSIRTLCSVGRIPPG